MLYICFSYTPSFNLEIAFFLPLFFCLFFQRVMLVFLSLKKKKNFFQEAAAT